MLVPVSSNSEGERGKGEDTPAGVAHSRKKEQGERRR